MKLFRSHPPASPGRNPRSASFALPALALALVLAGCSSLQPHSADVPAVPVPAGWSAASAGAAATPLAQWWGRLGDPELTALITEALAANTSVRSAQAALQQSRALVDVQTAGTLPQIGASASAQRSRASGSTGNSYSAGFDASWEPDVFGRLRAGVAATEADARAAEASLADVQVSLAAEVAVNYIELRGLQQRLQIARSNLASQQETLQIAQWRLQAGLTTSLVTEQARAAAEQTAAQVPALQSSLAQSRHSLAVLTGQAPAALDARLAVTAPVPTAPNDLALDIPAQTLRQRPDVRAAEHRVAAAVARVAQADAARYPDFSLSGSLGLRALTLGTLTGGNSVASALAASLSASLFDGGAAKAQVRSQQAALEQVRVGYEAAVLTALKDVEDALVALQGDNERLARLQAAADAAANAALMAQQRYSSGLIDFATVLETQRTQLSAQDSVATTVASVAADHVRLYKALGGGWQ
ncbi:NodT family efflux transporter outer membrane factor (OMF) lipoprotein [Acidovorax sp. 62]|uniref:efflux transporter outer membrane subunit n=1 Tax=Acidovorax sp. 62 TaxID=2035203 RepID=UPI000C1A01C1|nr:efflux transporter outer membrane subunit [Acidovorax sp. 62]PIF90099.1 NodT family efflux transporter outer membrane factor (OMF) lipoprotein [Acidovorax sp. 62]